MSKRGIVPAVECLKVMSIGMWLQFLLLSLWNNETNVSCVSQLPIIHSQLELRWQKSLKCWSFAFALYWVGTSQGHSGVFHIICSLSTGAHPMCQAPGWTNHWVDTLRMKKWKLNELLCVCVNVFPKDRNKMYPEVAQQWSHGEFRSLHVQFYMLSFAPEVWWCVCCQSLLAPWGMKSHFTCQMLVCPYPEMTWTFQIDSSLEASVALQIVFLIYISVAGDMKLRHLPSWFTISICWSLRKGICSVKVFAENWMWLL